MTLGVLFLVAEPVGNEAAIRHRSPVLSQFRAVLICVMRDTDLDRFARGTMKGVVKRKNFS